MGGVSVNFNAAEAVGVRMINIHRRSMGVSMEKLATGNRINRASDDPAGSMAATALKGERGEILNQLSLVRFEARRNDSFDANLQDMGDALLEIKNHILTAANSGGTTRAEREAAQIEVNGIVDGLVVQGSLSGINIADLLQSNAALTADGTSTDGAPSTDASAAQAAVSLNALRTGGTLNLVTGDLEKADQFVQGVFDAVVTRRGMMGARQRELDAQERELSNRDINLAAALSQIQDTDYAKETAELARTQILTETATAAVQTARDLQAETVLALIRGDTVEEVRADRAAEGVTGDVSK